MMNQQKRITITVAILLLGCVIFWGRKQHPEYHGILMGKSPAHTLTNHKKYVGAYLLYPKPTIISRKQRGADEALTYEKPTDNPIATGNIPPTPPNAITHEGGHKLARPIQHSPDIRAITIHHTVDVMTGGDKATLDWALNLHSIKKERGDIGYNFIIGKNGTIYEGRKGGETAIGAHSMHNNTRNIGISIMGNYNKQYLSPAQQDSLIRLVAYLSKKYHIDLQHKQPFLKKCRGEHCTRKLITHYQYPLLGHKDISGATECPGDHLHKQIESIRKTIMQP